MANYVANHRKKLEILRRRRLELLRLLDRNAAIGELAKAAEAVRDSQVRALKAKQAQIPPCDQNAKRFRDAEAEITRCRERTDEEIIDLCRQSRSKLSL